MINQSDQEKKDKARRTYRLFFPSLLSAENVTAWVRSINGTLKSNRMQITGEKRNYSSPEWAGTEHRGRTTEVEAVWVRNNLETANKNRAREGQAPINIKDPKMIKRYSFQ